MEGIFAFQSIFKAYLECRKRKRNTVNALKYETDLLENIVSLGESLSSGSYKPLRSVCFVTAKPKLREIFAADFRDRVVHHLLVPRLDDVFETKFIFDSYACREKKGTHAAVKKLRCFMNAVSNRGKRPAWFLQLDIKNFFMTIDKEILLEILSRRIKDAVLLELAGEVIKYDPSSDFIYKGNPALLTKVPVYKSLLNAPKNKGLPIGNLSSQFFANVYLDRLDQYVKHVLKSRHYVRYVDDMVFLHESRDVLIEFGQAVEHFLRTNLKLELKQNRVLKRVNEGADFLGYIVRPSYILVRRRVVANFKSKLADFKRIMTVNGAIGKKRYLQIHIRPEIVTRLRQTIASYLGHFKHADSFKLVHAMFSKNELLAGLFAAGGDYCLIPKYLPPFEPGSLRTQYGWFRIKFDGLCVFFQVGRFCEFHGEEAVRYARLFGLKTATGRKGMGERTGFPVRLLSAFKRKAMLAGISYVVVAETGFYSNGLKKRAVTEMVFFGRGIQ